MDSYTPLLEKIRLPQPSLQKFAVTSIFTKLRSAPKYLDSESEPGREAISLCLLSASPAVVDQSVRELCRMVKDSHLDISRGLLELQSALEGSDPLFVDVFVKGLGSLVRFWFGKHNGLWKLSSTETHPFVKVLSCRNEVQSELVHQVLLFMGQNESLGMKEVCEFLRPFIFCSILRMPFSDSSSSLFVRHLVSSMASFCCSLPQVAIPVFKLLTESLKYVQFRSLEDFWNFTHLAESIVYAYTMVLRLLVGRKSHLTIDAQQCGIELLETILFLCIHMHSNGYERIIQLSKCLLSVQKDLGLRYVPELSSALLSLFMILSKSELEHEQLSVLKLLLFLMQWKGEDEDVDSATACYLSEETLFIFPVISLMSSPSKAVKGVATDLLAMLEKFLLKMSTTQKCNLEIKQGYSSRSTPGSVVFRLLQTLWCQGRHTLSGGSFLDFAFTGKCNSKGMHDWPRKSWMSQIREYSLWIVNRRKSSLPLSQSQEVFIAEMPCLLSAIAGALVMHQSFGHDAVDLMGAVAILDPKIGVPLLLAILFYSNILTRKEVLCQNMSLKLLEMLPALGSHSPMVPLVTQTISPMLHKEAKSVLYATATRLLCQTWEINDRAFGSLQGILQPKGFTDFMSERDICLSLAVSVRDVCKRSADRGVDLILSVSACIESQDPTIQALGFQGLAHLCEADVIDFYTAWNVIAKNVLDYSADPIHAQSISILLRWGAMDAEAYPEASQHVIQILWNVGTSTCPSNISQWRKARVSAFNALCQYEVPHLEKNIPDFKQRRTMTLLSETNRDVLSAMEELLVKIIAYEHVNRRRLVKEKRVAESKIEKLLDVLPRVIFSSGKRSDAKELPGAALLCLSFTPEYGNDRRASSATQDEHGRFENMLVEVAASLQLSRNIFIALLSLESWKSFMGRWMKADMSTFDAKTPAATLDRTCKVASDILKRIILLTEEAIPRSAENMALAIGALCMVLPPSAHTIKSSASRFLLNWLYQHEHEHRQWAAAISLGLISSCLHVTDHRLKVQIICGLAEILHGSKSMLVKGACGIGLGFSSQDLLASVVNADKSELDKQAEKIQDIDLLGVVVRALTSTICQLTESASEILDGISSSFLNNTSDIVTNITAELSGDSFIDLEEDIWGIAGLVLGLASSIGAIFRAGEYAVVLKIKQLIISWIPHVNSLIQSTDFRSEESGRVLSVGSCLALPFVVAFCQRVELMDDNELDHLINGYKELILELVSVKKSGAFRQSLLMASCIGAGSLLSCILNEGVHSIKVECVKDLLKLFRTCYSSPYPPLIHFGGMLGVINSLGADAGNLVRMHPLTPSTRSGYDLKESSHLMGPLLSSRICEPQLTSMMQEIFLIAQKSDNQQMQQYASWAVSFLRHRLWLKDFLNIDNVTETGASGSRSVSQTLAEDSVVMRLSVWLMDLNLSRTGATVHVGIVGTVLRCLSQAPRLPALDWVAMVRRCMRYEDQVAELLIPAPAMKKGILREECLLFSFAHANQFDPLLLFLDELSDFSRFRTLEPNLQSCLLVHLADLIKVFSGSRIDKLFDDMRIYLSSAPSNQVDFHNQQSFLRISFWKGLYQCLDEASVDTLEYIFQIEKCMEVLFSLLPVLRSGNVDQVNSVEEWSGAVSCLGKARRQWLSDFLQASPEDLSNGDGQLSDGLKKIRARAKVIRAGSLPLSELGILKSQILNSKSEVMWGVLVEVVAALQQAEASVKRQWLIDALEISCVSSYPSTALQFLGLLSGSCCKYMPLLILDPQTVLNDLPVTLTSLLLDSSWSIDAEPIVSRLFTSSERIYNWVSQTSNGDDIHKLQPIDESENNIVSSLFKVLHDTCVFLKDYLPLEKQLRLANMKIA